MQKKSTHQPKVIVKKIPKQIPLLVKRPVFYMKNNQRITYIQSKHNLQAKIVNPQASVKKTFIDGHDFCLGSQTKGVEEKPLLFLASSANLDSNRRTSQFPFKKWRSIENKPPFLKRESVKRLSLTIANRQAFSTLMEGPYTQIFKWGGRGHIFDRLTFFSKTNNHKLSYEFKNPKYNHSQNTESDGLGLLFRTDDSSSFANRTYENENPKMLSYSSPFIHEKQNGKTWKGNSNYYACISQLTSWGSDHGSWILFLKYIRANIYKGDQLLPLYFNKMNFQMMPRTGSIMLQQLLNQLELVPKAFSQSLESNFISKQKSVSKNHPWPNSVVGSQSKVENSYTNTTKDTDTTTHKPINKTNQDLIIRELTSQDFHYHSSFFLNQAQEVAKINKNLQVTPNRFLSKDKSLINYKTFSIFDSLVFLKKNLQRTISIRLNNTLSLMKKPTSFSNKYALYAYKIKKPVSHKRFRKIYQLKLNSCKPINNWYRLNNFFSYSQAERLSPTLASVFQNNSLKHGRVFGLDSQTKDAKRQTYRDYMIRERNIFDTSTNVAITPHQIISDPKDQTHYFHLDESVPCYIPVVGNDIRILKLIYSLIVSFQLQFLPVNKRAKKYNNRSRDNKNLFNPSYYPTTEHLSLTLADYGFTLPFKDLKGKINHNREKEQLISKPSENGKDINSSFSAKSIFSPFLVAPHQRQRATKNGEKIDSSFRVSNKAINEHPTYKISNTYYHIYSNQNNHLKDELWYSKSRIWGLSTKKNFIMSNGTGFDRYHHFFLQNSVWLRSYSLKSKDIYKLSSIKPWLLKNHNRNRLSIASSKKSFQATPKTNLTNGVFKSYYNQNCSENFYFFKPKNKNL